MGVNAADSELCVCAFWQIHANISEETKCQATGINIKNANLFIRFPQSLPLNGAVIH